MNILVSVKNKIATLATPEIIVCGNSDYKITFTFDDEWLLEPIKTARFVYRRSGENKYEDVVFSGNTVEVPVLSNISAVLVGVYAGELRTTTPAVISCEKSILCGGGTNDGPSEDVYNQILDEINELIGLAGSHPIRIDNPHNVTAKQVGARPDTWMPTLDDIGAQAKHWRTVVSLLDGGWIENSQVVGVNGLTAQDTVIVSADPDSYDEYCEAGVRCVAQADGVLTFKCKDVPKVTLSVNLSIMGFGASSGGSTDPFMLNMDILEDGYTVRAEVGDEIYGVKNATVNQGVTENNYDFTVT